MQVLELIISPFQDPLSLSVQSRPLQIKIHLFTFPSPCSHSRVCLSRWISVQTLRTFCGRHVFLICINGFIQSIFIFNLLFQFIIRLLGSFYIFTVILIIVLLVFMPFYFMVLLPTLLIFPFVSFSSFCSYSNESPSHHLKNV